MGEVPSKPKYLKNFITPRLLGIIENLYDDDEGLESYYHHNHFTNYLESPGDLSDIIKLNCHIMDNAYEIKYIDAQRIFHFIKASEGVLFPPELDRLESLQSFIKNYPNLYRTLKIWAFG